MSNDTLSALRIYFKGGIYIHVDSVTDFTATQLSTGAFTKIEIKYDLEKVKCPLRAFDVREVIAIVEVYT